VFAYKLCFLGGVEKNRPSRILKVLGGLKIQHNTCQGWTADKDGFFDLKSCRENRAPRFQKKLKGVGLRGEEVFDRSACSETLEENSAVTGIWLSNRPCSKGKSLFYPGRLKIWLNQLGSKQVKRRPGVKVLSQTVVSHLLQIRHSEEVVAPGKRLWGSPVPSLSWGGVTGVGLARKRRDPYLPGEGGGPWGRLVDRREVDGRLGGKRKNEENATHSVRARKRYYGPGRRLRKIPSFKKLLTNIRQDIK